MELSTQALLAFGILALAYYIRGISGYGSGLLAIPTLALFMPLGQIVPVIAVLDFLAALTQGLRYHKLVNWQELGLLVPIATLGMGLGLLLLNHIDGETLKPWLGAFISIYAIYTLLPQTQQRISARWSMPLSTTGGMVDTLFGTGGPFFVIYLRLRQLDKTVFVATIAMTFMLNLFIRIGAYGVAGFYTVDMLLLILAGLPIMLLAMILGMRTHHRISAQQFRVIIAMLLIVSGIGLLTHSGAE